MVAAGGILSSERLEVHGEEEEGEEERDYLQTHTHLIKILKCIVDEKTAKTLML